MNAREGGWLVEVQVEHVRLAKRERRQPAGGRLSVEAHQGVYQKFQQLHQGYFSFNAATGNIDTYFTTVDPEVQKFDKAHNVVMQKLKAEMDELSKEEDDLKLQEEYALLQKYLQLSAVVKERDSEREAFLLNKENMVRTCVVAAFATKTPHH